MSDELGDLPEAKTDAIDRAPGGADATVLESDTGATMAVDDPDAELTDSTIGDDQAPGPVTPDQPLAAQTDETEVPDAIQEPERQESDEQSTDNTDDQAPSG